MNFDRLLVTTKFAPPRLGTRYLPRKQLLDQLRNAQRCTLTLVTGSAGFGKTVLLAQWRLELMKAGAVVSWLSLSHDDRQLPVFCAYLLGALQRLGIAVEEEVLMEGDNTQSVDNMVALAVNGAAAIAKDLYLIIDDYHHVEDPWAHKLMQKLLDNSPDNLHIAIASRIVPPLSISRLRVLGRVTEIDFEQLPFDLEETRLFFEQGLGSMKLNGDEIQFIHDLTHGWPASLQLLAIMLKSRPATRSRLRELSLQSSDLQNYLAEDVVAHLPAELHEFMETISVCRRFNDDLSVFVTGNPHAPEIIRRAEEENLLIYRVESDDSSPWFRFHPLFSEFLQSRLARHGRERVNEHHRRASQWFARNGFLADAVRHAIWANDLESAVTVIEHAAPETWGLAYISPMLNLLERLPQETLFAHPQLFFLGCLTFALTARHTKAQKWISQIRESEAVKNPAISSRLALADATVAMQHDDAQRAIDLLEPLKDVSADNRFLHYMHLTVLSSAYAATGRHADAQRLLDEHPIPIEDRKNDMALVVESSRISKLLTEGRIKEAARMGSMLLARAEAAHGRRSICANLCAATVSDACYELDLIDTTREALANRFGILRSSAPEVMLRATLCRARLDHLQESPDTALAFLGLQCDHFQNLRLDRLVACTLGEQIQIRLAMGDRRNAAELGTKLDTLAIPAGNKKKRPEIAAIAALAQARLALANNDPARALQSLSIVRLHAQDHGLLRNLAQTDLLCAIASDDMGRMDEAMAHLAQAVNQGYRLGLIRTFVDEGPRSGALLARLRTQNTLDKIVCDYLDGLLTRFKDLAPASQHKGASDRNKPAAADTANLTPRELEILSLISQAMSNKRIALTLNITLETVKWNVRNILAKLGVSSRYDAMAWARKTGLIE